MPKAKGPEPLSSDMLCFWRCEQDFDFKSTAELSEAKSWLGQDRAVDTIRMAAQIGHNDFNAFVLGNAGSGRQKIVRSILDNAAAVKTQPDDWVYVNNFEQPHMPTAMKLPAGMAKKLKSTIETLIDELANDIPALFESEEYQTRRRTIEQSFSTAHEQAMSKIFEKARSNGLGILRGPMGFTVTGMKDGEVLKQDEFEALDEEEQHQIETAIEDIQKALSEVLKSVPASEKDRRRQVEDLNYSMTTAGVDQAIGSAQNALLNQEHIKEYLAAVRRDVIENAELFLIQDEGAEIGAFPVATTKHYAKPQFQRYRVNVMVSHETGGADGAPVVQEDLPTLANLIGRIDFSSEMGTLVTDFTKIKPGSLHRANGGFLVLKARDVLTEPLAWDALKRSLRTEEVSIYSPADRLSLTSTLSLKPDPIPLEVRVILIGERMHYYLLAALDPEFNRLFKLEADFNDHIDIEEATVSAYASLLGSLAHSQGIRALTAAAVARVFVESTRMTGDTERLSLNVDELSDVLREADFWAGQDERDDIDAADVERALSERERRASRVRELSQQSIARGTILIDTDGTRVGQINALSVLQIGDYRFGKPSRLTARTRMGSGKLIDIEREADLGGPLHSKGMLILQGFLAATYATNAPMSLWASLVFEQSYGGVDGDSASAAELIAVLSSLADVSLDQSFAITGSINQFGEVQAIGGVNEKIEGFFDICNARGLTGRQGVLIPTANVKHLALRKRVVDAVERDEFRIIPMTTVFDGIETLTGMSCGKRGKTGTFPKANFNRRVEDQLMHFADLRKSFAKSAKAEGGDNESE